MVPKRGESFLRRVRAQLIIAGEMGYLPSELANDWITETRELSRMLAGLINKISN
ncbi:hypothetical protein [Pseudomonas capeferrum]|uniref:hypothetical protein n=1 Tax=Pseudomonas capeferrum TaxID=1495066 RepID=UPI003BB4EE84